MFRCYDHVCRPEECVRTCRVDGQLVLCRFSVLVGNGEVNFRAFRTSNPVALHRFDAFRPVQTVQIRQQFVCIRGDFQNPLSDDFVGDGCPAPFAFSFLYFLVCKARLALRTPVDWCFRLVCQSLLVQLEEDPLCPLIVVCIAGDDTAVPVVAESQSFNLLCEVVNILERCCCGMCPCFDCIVFGGQTERIVSHRVQDIVTVHAQVAAVYISCGVAFRMSDMKSGTARVREHVQNVSSFFFREPSVLGCLESFVCLPVFLPFRLNSIEWI